MLKNIIIPEKIGNYFLFSQRIVGFDINKKFVNATQLYVQGNRNIKIEKYFEEKLILNDSISETEKISHAINNIISKVKKYDYIKVCLPAYLVIFKELTLPFTDLEKIKSILDFEIEPILPFSIDEAVSDFITTKIDKKNKTTTIFVAVARKKDILELIEPFKLIGINPSSIIVDIIGIYGLYKSLPSNLQSNEYDTILLELEFNYINIIYLQNGQLKLVRSISQGIYQIVKSFANSVNIEFDRASEYINKYGIFEIENEEYSKALNNALFDFNSNLAFTLSSFRTLLPSFSEIKKISVIGKGVDINNIDKYLYSKFNIPCELITINTILQNNITTKEKIPNSAILSLSIAYPTETNENFNLLQKELEITNKNLLMKQFFTTIFFILLIISMLIVHTHIQIKKLRKEKIQSQTELMNSLKNTFNITDPAILRNPSEMINSSNSIVNEEENIWFSFSKNARFSFLKYLQELSSIIDKQAIGLNLKSLSISEGLITLEGEVKDFKGLEILENELNESKLFSHVTIPQETKFTIKLTIKNNEGIE